MEEYRSTSSRMNRSTLSLKDRADNDVIELSTPPRTADDDNAEVEMVEEVAVAAERFLLVITGVESREELPSPMAYESIRLATSGSRD